MNNQVAIIQPDWPAPATVAALGTTRMGGRSRGAFQGLNLATHVGDEIETVESNRALLRSTLDLPSEPCWLNQTHSHNVALLNYSAEFDRNCDAAICRDPGQVAVVMTADCLPILLCNKEGSEVAAVHAGWRGLADGIIEETLSKMHSNSQQLMVWIGPAISQQHFEVGRDVYELFVGQDQQAQTRFIKNRPEHWLCDLAGLAEIRLRNQGVSTVFQSGLCSFNDASRFYSYRRDKRSGRMACLIWIKHSA